MRKKRELLSFDLTPLIDIIFLLLIFFMVFSVFQKDKFTLDIKLPVSKSSQNKTQKKSVSIELNNSFLAFDGEKISFSDFKDMCNTIEHEKVIVLSIDKEVKYAKIVDILDILKEKNLQNISLLVKK